jgi:hypothetical protein
MRLVTALLAETSEEWGGGENLPQHGTPNPARSMNLANLQKKELRSPQARIVSPGFYEIDLKKGEEILLYVIPS